MKKYKIIGYAFLIAGSIIFGIFLIIDLSSACLYPPMPSGFPDMKPEVLRCRLVYVHLPVIIISIAMIITGMVLKTIGRNK